MARFLKDRISSKGKPPGSLILIGRQKMEHPVITLMDFDAKKFSESELKSIDECIPLISSKTVSWINIYGIHDLELVNRIGEIFNFSPLFLEEILNTDQRPKYEDGENYDAFILKMLKYDEVDKIIKAEQITLVLGQHYVLTLQEQPGDVFNPVRERIRQKNKRIKNSNNDYLTYALLDTIVDNYVLLIENLGREIEELEEKLFNNPSKSIVEDIHKYKMELNFLRKSIRPVKDLMIKLLSSDSSFFHEKNMSFLKNLNELVIQSTDAIELYHNMVSDHLNIYNTNTNNRLNEVMKVLTIFAAIFIPLTFIAGIYGMNFEYMPELKYKYSYFIFWIIILTVGSGLLIYFKRKKWF